MRVGRSSKSSSLSLSIPSGISSYEVQKANSGDMEVRGERCTCAPRMIRCADAYGWVQPLQLSFQSSLDSRQYRTGTVPRVEIKLWALLQPH
eukprot:IDg9785t1